MARPTLNDILFEHKLDRSQLHKECSPDILLTIAERVSEWNLFGRYLGIPKQDLSTIGRQYDTNAQKTVATFNIWHEREGTKATYLRLADALYQYGRRDLITLLCLIISLRKETTESDTLSAIGLPTTVPESKTEAMFRSNLEDIKSRFAILLRSVQLALEANHVSPQDVHAVLVGMFGCRDLIPKTNLEEMFTAVTSQHLWDYIHHSPVEKLLRRFQLSDHLSLMREYKAHLSGFYTTTKLIDFITYTSIDSTAVDKLDLRKLTDANYQKLKVKLELDRKIDIISFKYVQDLWEEFAEEFDIPYLTAVIGKILNGSLHITWIVTSEIANKIIAAARESSFFQEHPNIIYVDINGRVHYDEVEQCKANFKEKLSRGIEEVDLHTAEDQRLVNFIDRNVQLDCIKRLDLATNRQTYTVVVNSKARFCNITEYKQGRRAVIDAIKYEFITSILYTVFIVGFIIGLVTGIITGFNNANQMLYGSLVGAIGGALAVPIHRITRDNEETDFDIENNRLLAVRLIAIVLASGLIGASGNASIGAAMGAISAAFIGSLIASVISRKAIKSIANATIFAISLGTLVGMAVEAVGGTVPGTISGAITAGAIAITFDGLEATFRTTLATGMFSGTVKTITGVVTALPREDAYGLVAGTILGAILNNFLNYHNMLGNGPEFGAAVGAVIATAMYIKHPNVTDPVKIFYSIMIFLVMFYLRVINLVLGGGATGAMGGLIAAAMISRALIHPPDNPLFNPFRYKAIFAAIAASCAAAGVMSFFLPVYIIRLFMHKLDFPAPVGRTILVATIGAAIGGYLLAKLVNMAGLRLVDGAFTRINDRSIAAVHRILRRFDVSIILGAVGAVIGTFIAFIIEAFAGEKLTGVAMAAIMGAITGTASGAFATIAMTIIRNITVPVITKMCTDQEIKTIIITTIASAFVGGVCGGYFTSSVVAGILVALAFPVVTMVMYTAPVYAERRHRFKRVNRISLVRVMNKFGIELRNLTNEETQNNWIRYKIAKVP